MALSSVVGSCLLDASLEFWRSQFRRLVDDQIACLVLRHFADPQLLSRTRKGIEALGEFVPHDDVPGLRVLGLSHFQAVRAPALFSTYSRAGRMLPGLLEEASLPTRSPFDAILHFLGRLWPAGVEPMVFETEPPPAPFTIRSYANGVRIEAHQDIITAESPEDSRARLIKRQLALNLFLRNGAGGDLNIYDLSQADTGYSSLEDGPKAVAEEQLPVASVHVHPTDGDLIMFDSTRVHKVCANRDVASRVTLSMFLGLEHTDAPIRYWI